jgi:hypothetical protein
MANRMKTEGHTARRAKMNQVLKIALLPSAHEIIRRAPERGGRASTSRFGRRTFFKKSDLKTYAKEHSVNLRMFIVPGSGRAARICAPPALVRYSWSQPDTLWEKQLTGWPNVGLIVFGACCTKSSVYGLFTVVELPHGKPRSALPNPRAQAAPSQWMIQAN